MAENIGTQVAGIHEGGSAVKAALAGRPDRGRTISSAA